MGELWHQFDPGTRVLWVNPEYFAYIQNQCRIDPQWPDRLAAQFGIGPVDVRVIHTNNPPEFTGLPRTSEGGK